MSARKARRPRRKKTSESARTKKADHKSSSDVGRLLNRLADAISLIATAASALDYAHDVPATDDPADAADKVRCLVLGLHELSRVRIEIAVALVAVTR